MSERLRVGMKVSALFGEGHIARRLADGNFVLFWVDHPLATSRCGWSWIEECSPEATKVYRDQYLRPRTAGANEEE